MTPPLVGLVGPTAVGKTEVALELAEHLGAEIISVDSRQVYRGLDIGTAKPSPAERRRVPHHLVDCADPRDVYSAGRYQRDASECIERLRERGVRPLLVGGSGLYLRALLRGLCDGPTADPVFRGEWLARERAEAGSIYRRLTEVDPASASAIHPHDRSKALRAVEVHAKTGASLSVIQREHGFRVPRYEAVLVGLRRERDDLYRRIDARVDAMLEQGLMPEVAGLLREGYRAEDPGMLAVGYRHIAAVLLGGDLHAAVESVKRETRRYAKRQMTWFGADRDIRWIDLSPDASASDTVERVMAALEEPAAVAGHRR
ncbi:MAG: tRNA (adenosine(37)-N6)-dimethylallyltransferase MiaA [Nitrospiria bacterium]